MFNIIKRSFIPNHAHIIKINGKVFSTKISPLARKRTSIPLKTRLRTVIEEDKNGKIIKNKQPEETVEISKPELFQVNDVLTERLESFFSQDIHKLLKSTPSFNVRHGRVFNFLGTSVDKIKNPYLVAEDVERQLKKGSLSKSIYIARLARSNGSVGMNLILKYVLNKDFDVAQTTSYTIKDTEVYQNHLAHKIYRVLRKWGVPDNANTYSIMFNRQSGGALIDKKGVDSLIDRYEKSVAGLPRNNATITVNANATLAAIADKATMDQVIDFYQEIPKKDKITYTTILNIIGRKLDGLVYREEIWQDFLKQTAHRQGIRLDGPLVRAYFFATMKEEDGYEVVLNQFEDYFDLTGLVGMSVKENTTTTTTTATPLEKLPIEKPELSILLKCLYETQKYDVIFELFDKLKTSPLLDLSHYNVYIKSIQNTRSLDLIPPLVKAFTTKTDLKPSSEMYATLIRAFINTTGGDTSITTSQANTINDILALSKDHTKKHSRLLLPVASAYCELFNHIYSNPTKPTGTFDRNQGLKALRTVLNSTPNLIYTIRPSTSTSFETQVQAIQSIITLCEQLEKRRWSNDISTWIYKSRKALTQFKTILEQTTDSLAIKAAIHEFNDQMTLVTKIMTGK